MLNTECRDEYVFLTIGDIYETFISNFFMLREFQRYFKYQNIGTALHIETRASNFLVTRTSCKSFLPYLFLRRECRCVSYDLLSSLEGSTSRGYSLLRIRYFPPSDVAPGVISWEPRRLHFGIPFRPSLFSSSCLVPVSFWPSLRFSCRSIRSHEFPWNYVTPGVRAERAEPTDNYFRS